jgi:hypothetical protein
MPKLTFKKKKVVSKVYIGKGTRNARMQGIDH